MILPVRLRILLSAALLVTASTILAQQPSGQKITPPTLDHGAPPNIANCTYPRDETPTAKVHLVVDADGKPQQVAVTKSSGVACLDEAAIASAQAYAFHPAVGPDGAPVAVPLDVEIKFAPKTAAPAASAPSGPATTGAFTAAGTPIYQCNEDGKGPIAPPQQVDKGNVVPPPELAGHYEATFLVVVNESGKTESAKVVKTSDAHLDKWALATVGAYRFHPAMLGDKPVAVELTIRLAFDK